MGNKKFCALLMLSVLAILLTGCGASSKNLSAALPSSGTQANSSNPPASTAPAASISANPNAIQPGQSALLTWQTQNATDVSIAGLGKVGVNGSQSVNPTSTTDFVLVAKGPGGTAQASATVTVTAAPPAAKSPVPHSSHVFLVIEENHGFAAVYPNGMPWLAGEGNANGYTTDYHADNSGSLLDYLWLSSGSCHNAVNCTLPVGTNDFGCNGGGCAHTINDANIFRELNNAGLSWKEYAESLPSVGFMGDGSGAYVKRHNPAAWYSDVVNSGSQQQNMVPFTQFKADMDANRFPNYSIIIPNLQNDAHDGTVAQADDWLRANVAPLLNQPYFQPGGDGLLIITFDECDAAASGYCGGAVETVYTAVIGPNVKHGFVSRTFYKHENTLRTMLDALGVNVYPGASNGAADMADFFQ